MAGFRVAVFGEGLLALAEGRDQVVELGLECGLAGVRVGLRDEGEEVAAVVAAQVAVGGFPAARRPCATRVQSGVRAEDGQDSVGRVGAGVVEHQVTLGPEDAPAESDLLQAERPHRPGRLGGQCSRGGLGCGAGGGGLGPRAGGDERGRCGRGAGGQAQHAASGGWLEHGALRSSSVIGGQEMSHPGRAGVQR